MQVEPFVLQEKTLGALLDETIARHADSDAVLHLEHPLRQTWAEFGGSVDELARGLMALGVKKGEKVAIWATNVPHWATLMLASARIGAVLITVNTSCHARELEFLLRQSDCENLFMAGSYRDHDFIGILEAVIPQLHEQDVNELDIPSLPGLRRIFLMGDRGERGLPCLADVMARASEISSAEYEARKAEVSPHDVVNMQYTSGTTGSPKGVMLSHVSMINNGYWIGRHQNFSASDRLCLSVPLFHCFGCVLGVVTCLNHGAAMVIIDAFNPLQVMRAIEKERCTVVYGVPSMYLSMLEHRHFSRYDLRSLRTGVMAGSVCPEYLLRRVIEQMHMKEITICYGMTEASPVMTQTHADEDFARRVATVGRAMPGIDVLVADPSLLPGEVRAMPRGLPGEVICRGYNVMRGYYNLPEETELAVTPGGWLRSGDLGVMDENGYLVITGRIKDMIIRGGENIYPREIEEFISGMEGVADIQVVSVPSRRYGEEAAAFIIAVEGARLEEKDVRAYCKGRLAWHKVPRYMAFVDSYPMTGSGKIQKFRLREMARELFSEAANR